MRVPFEMARALLMRPEPHQGDEIGLAMYLADINGEDWATWTPERRAQIENIALTAMAAVRESGRE